MPGEAFYDREIAPALLDLAKKCEENGLSMAAMVEWDPGETGRTVTLRKGAGFGMLLADLAMRSNNNVDALIFALMKYGREHGHNSICLAQLERDPSHPASPGQPTRHLR